jgi:hypothetical protein
MAEKTIKITDATIEITFDEKTGEITDASVAWKGAFLSAYPMIGGILIKINALGDGWKKYIVPQE